MGAPISVLFLADAGRSPARPAARDVVEPAVERGTALGHPVTGADRGELLAEADGGRHRPRRPGRPDGGRQHRPRPSGLPPGHAGPGDDERDPDRVRVRGPSTSPPGPVVRRLGRALVPVEPATARPTAPRPPSRRDASRSARWPPRRPRTRSDVEGPDVIDILTDTLVETPDLVAVFASVGHEALWANDAFVTLIPIREADKIWLVELLDEWSKGHYEVKVLPALVKYGRWRGRLTLRRPTTELVPVSAVIVAHRDRDGEIDAVSLVARDLDRARARPEERRRRDRARFAALVENAADIIAVVDRRRHRPVRSARPTPASSATARARSTAPTCSTLVHPDDAPADLLVAGQARRAGHRLAGRAAAAHRRRLVAPPRGRRHRSHRQPGHRRARAQRPRRHRAGRGGAGAGRPGLHRRRSPGCPTACGCSIGWPRRWPTPTVGAGRRPLVCDIDQFKTVNDACRPRRPATSVLQDGRRPAARRRCGDRDPVARLGGDEFAVVLAGVGRRRRRRAARQPLRAGRRASRSSSTGGDVELQPERRHRARRRRATSPRACCTTPSGPWPRPRRTAATASRCSTRELAELASAAASTSSSSCATPSTTTACACTTSRSSTSRPSRSVGAEALLRVHDDEGALLSPAEFIEAAESSGLIARLGSQVLQITCEQLAAWTRAPAGRPLARALGQRLAPPARRSRPARHRCEQALERRRRRRPSACASRSPRAS